MTAYQVFAFCEGIWATPQWIGAVDLTPKYAPMVIAWTPQETAA